MNAPLPAMSRMPTPAMAGTSRRSTRQAERVTSTTATIRRACVDADHDQRTEHVAIADLGDAHAHGADADAGQQGQLQARAPGGRVADARDEDHRHDRQRDPDQDERRRDALQDDAGGDRDDGRHHAGHGRDDPHPADGQPLVERPDPDPAGDPGRARSSRGRPAAARSRRGRSPGPARAPARRTARSGRPRTAPFAWSAARHRSRRAPGHGGEEAEQNVADAAPPISFSRAVRSVPPRVRCPPARATPCRSSAGRRRRCPAPSGRRARRRRPPRRRSGRRRRQVDDLEVGRDGSRAGRARGSPGASSRVTNGSSKMSGGRRSPVTSLTSPSRATR